MRAARLPARIHYSLGGRKSQDRQYFRIVPSSAWCGKSPHQLHPAVARVRRDAPVGCRSTLWAGCEAGAGALHPAFVRHRAKDKISAAFLYHRFILMDTCKLTISCASFARSAPLFRKNVAAKVRARDLPYHQFVNSGEIFDLVELLYSVVLRSIILKERDLL